MTANLRRTMAPDAAGAAAEALGTLPEWDLTDLYPAPDSPELEADLTRATVDAEGFRKAHEGRVADMDGAALGAAVAAYEAIQETLSRVMSYAQLVFAGDMSDPEIGKFYQTMQERVNDITANLLFFTLEINRLEDGDVEQRTKVPALAGYAAWVRDTRVFRPHQLSDEIEKVLHEKYVVGRAAWVRLFDETLAGLRFAVDGRELTCTEVLNRLSDKDPDSRRTAALALGEGLAENRRLFALITNTLAKDKEIDDKLRGYQRPVSFRNLSNHVEDAVVDALVGAVRDACADLSHRYYRLKAGWFGVEALDYWDRNAPLPDDDDLVIPWGEAKQTVLDAYHAFSPDLATIGRQFFDNAWIDAPARPGKASGAFSHSTVPSAHPYILMNYLGRTRDVMTLAHELGHGVHQVSRHAAHGELAF